MDFFSLLDIQKQIADKKISPEELVRFYLKKIKKHNPTLKAFISVNESAYKEANNKKGLLRGIPIGVKDLFCTQELTSTAGSKALENYVSPYTATCVEKLQAEGAIIIGKCNNDEFGMGSTGENSYFGACPNPWNSQHVTGGSSSGSAGAVSAGLCPVALGTDTGGSVRLPAHYCHLLGLKPTYGRISRYGMIAYASSLDQAGILSHDVESAALLLDIMSGFDSRDSTSFKSPPTAFQKNLNFQVKGQKIAYFNFDNWKSSIAPEIFQAYQKVLKLLEFRGCELLEKEFPYLDYGISVYYLISTSEASSNLARYDGLRYGYQSLKSFKSLQDFYANNRSESFGKEVQKRIFTGTFSLSAGYYKEYFYKACQVRNLIKQAFDKIFESCVALVLPVGASTAPVLGSQSDPLTNYKNDVFTVFANLIGSPALSLPCDFSKKNLPIGVQLLGPALGEQNILNLAGALEEELQIHKKRPCNWE